MSEELKNCSHCHKSFERKTKEEKIKYYTLTLNKKDIACCENCWEKNKESYKSQLKAEWDKLEEWERKDKYYNDKSYFVYVNIWTSTGICTTSHLSHGKLCRECDKWCDDIENGGEDGNDPFCSPQHKFITGEKRELKGLQEQWKLLKDFPENYPTRAETKKRKEELEKKYSNNPTPDNPSRERESILNYFKSHNIKSITLKGDELIIKYQDRAEELTLNASNNQQLQAIQAYCQNQGVNSLSFSDLQQNTQNPSGFNWKSPWVIGGGIVLVVGVIGLVVYLVKRNKKE